MSSFEIGEGSLDSLLPDKLYETILGVFHLLRFLSRGMQHCCDVPEIFVDLKM